MSSDFPQLPRVGDAAPAFEVHTQKGLIRFPEFSEGSWCIFFAHPANFTSAWRLYSNFLELKERWLSERNTKLLALSNEMIRQNDWADIVRRYIGIFLRAPVIEDTEHRIATQYGMASGRRLNPPYDRLLYIIDPQGTIRLILHRPLVSIQSAITELQRELVRLQAELPPDAPELPIRPLDLPHTPESSDAVPDYRHKPAYFRRNKLILN